MFRKRLFVIPALATFLVSIAFSFDLNAASLPDTKSTILDYDSVSLVQDSSLSKWDGDISTLCKDVAEDDDYSAVSDLTERNQNKVFAEVKKNLGRCIILYVSKPDDTYITILSNSGIRYSTEDEKSFHKGAYKPIQVPAPNKKRKTNPPIAK
jgi:dihydroneopterin aldolase